MDDLKAELLRALKLHKSHQFDAAERIYREILAAIPNHADSLHLLGLTQFARDDFDEALSSISKAIELKAGEAVFHSNRGKVLYALSRYDESICDFERALSIRPDYVKALVGIGQALMQSGRVDDAVSFLDQAVIRKPKFSEAHYYLAVALIKAKKYKDALAVLRMVQLLQPVIPAADGLVLDLTLRLSDWSNLAADLARVVQGLKRGHNSVRPYLLLMAVDEPDLHLKAAQLTATKLAKAKGNRSTNSSLTSLDNRRIRLAYFSSDFYTHATSYLMAHVFELHDKTRFELFAFCLSSVHRVDDPLRSRVRAAFDHFYEVGQLNADKVAQLTEQLKIDIAIDLNGYTNDHKYGLFCHRCAPIQINYLGYPGTLGSNQVDYIIADNVVIPTGSESYFSERVVRLPHSYQANDGRLRRISQRKLERAEFGLPDIGFVFCCFNKNSKILPATFDVWMRILLRVPGSVLWLLSVDKAVEANLRAEASARGVAPERLVFAMKIPIHEHLARHRLADLFVDTWPYNAHTTASDALWAGLPVLTRSGQSFASRVAASLLMAIGLPELVTHSDEDFENLAVALADNPERLTDIRSRLRANRLKQPLFDSKQFTIDLETLYLGLVNDRKPRRELASHEHSGLAMNSGLSARKNEDNFSFRIAVVTPYFKESLEILRKCHESVITQNLNVEHFMIADGFPQKVIDQWSVQHVKLPKAHADNGNTPRGIGGLIAQSQGFDFIAYLDADNWFHPNHLTSLLNLFSTTNASVLASFRTFHDLQGNHLTITEPAEDGLSHVDTSCFLVHKSGFELLPIWIKMPKELSTICDRVFYAAVKRSRLPVRFSFERSVAFRSQYNYHYDLAKVSRPKGLKDGNEFSEAFKFLQSRSGIDACLKALGFWPLSFL